MDSKTMHIGQCHPAAALLNQLSDPGVEVIVVVRGPLARVAVCDHIFRHHQGAALDLGLQRPHRVMSRQRGCVQAKSKGIKAEKWSLRFTL